MVQSFLAHSPVVFCCLVIFRVWSANPNTSVRLEPCMAFKAHNKKNSPTKKFGAYIPTTLVGGIVRKLRAYIVIEINLLPQTLKLRLGLLRGGRRVWEKTLTLGLAHLDFSPQPHYGFQCDLIVHSPFGFETFASTERVWEKTLTQGPTHHRFITAATPSFLA
ncbi:hypothetical protein IEQ34_002147 [Dendrobium chrysotoxum]|uniref:Secreted protein n=1 Tax=Dendrobium chrysotoxum TaxID=161865 RepID=A0AAV7H459_DENCH|nr:hypothetical protein IEQ34_002147 [Dendrobium chrysotoxum]